MKNLNIYIDHTNLKRDAIISEIDKTIEEAIKYQFKTVCIHPIWIEYVKEKLHSNNIGVTTVIGFPFGTQTTESKVFEAKDAIIKGADELDFVVNVSRVHEKDEKYLIKELNEIRNSTKGKIIKLILEIALLNNEEIIFISKLAMEAEFDFIKTSTGIGCGGATIDAVKIMKETVGNKIQIKASGGIKNFDDAVKMIDNGATRIGTSNGVQIMEGENSNNSY